MSNPLIQKAVEDITALVSEGVASLQEKPRDKWGVNEFRALEIINRCLSVCIDRENKKPLDNKFSGTSTEDLESEFD